MPTVRTTPIISSRDATDPHPWFVLEVDPDTLDVDVTEANGIRAFAQRSGRPAVSTQKQSAARRRHRIALERGARPVDEEPADPARPALADEVHVLAMTLDGDVEFVPASRERGVYYAHLGWYDPAIDEWELLEFIDADELLAAVDAFGAGR